ncbi:hypothetical protein [Psychrobacillus vulpis]|uniref:DUF3784 domain-containing protein n=1 Tax=Psychrobacillus vulpis TaxID=2325572 RepID=A0A544TDG0_9BACI|nr:hypothetical protein [Psychrobacillus vulpis]TQR15503.1 hypothetical protein FG384_19275 [Psychrobacillus vulpis]
MVFGILMIIFGFSHLMKSDYFLSKKTRILLGEEEFQSYQKGLVFPNLFTGTLIICMTIVEKLEILQTSTFIALYIILAIIPIILLIANNKINTGRYWFWVNDFK